MFESRISEEATEKLPGWEKRQAKTIAWSYDMEGHLKKCVERYCGLAKKKVEQLHKVSSLCIDDHQFKKEDLGSVGELSEVCFCIKNACIWRELDDPTFFGQSTNLLVQSPNGSKSTSGAVLCLFGSRALVLVNWMCKKQTSVSHSSTESGIISLDAGLRMNGLPTLDLFVHCDSGITFTSD